MKVFLGGTVNGSTWRNFVIPRLSIGYYNPVVPNWTEEALERELYERRHCDFCLYVITPKQTGFYKEKQGLSRNRCFMQRNCFWIHLRSIFDAF